MYICRIILLQVISLLSVQLLGQVMRSEKASVYINNMSMEVQDITPPKIEIIAPAGFRGDTYESTKPEVYLIGQVSDEGGISTVFLNGKALTTTEAGVFSQNMVLESGMNSFSFVVMDNNNNITRETLVINYENAEESLADKIQSESKYYALIIGIENYMDVTLTDLDNPIRDARRINDILLNHYTFEEENITLLLDARREDIINSLDELSTKLQPEDNLLIFYAGHGWWDQEANIGYWLPSDARKDRKSAWFRNSTLVDYLKEIKCKHTLLITDACFAGAIFKSRSAFGDAPKAIDLLYDLPSRKAMTSGTLTEVPDRSVFVKYFSDRLVSNTDKYMSAEELFSSFRIAVINNSDAIPQFGEIKGVGDEGGDFIFIRKEQ